MNVHATLWLTLSQAFLPPMRREVADALRQALVSDLEELCGEAGLDAGDVLHRLRRSLESSRDAEALLVHYSASFLAPPVRAHLNLGYYLNGTLNGPSLDALEAWYRHFELARAGNFRDLPDHLAMIFEFMALLACRGDSMEASAEFARRFLIPALPQLERALLEADLPESPYLQLLRLTHQAVHAFYPGDAAHSGHQRNRRTLDPARGELHYCSGCGQPFARKKEILILTKALADQGLPADHLALCPDCRDPAQGWEKRAVR